MFRYLRTQLTSAASRGTNPLGPVSSPASPAVAVSPASSITFSRWYSYSHDPEIANPNFPKKDSRKDWKAALNEDVTVIENAPHWNEKLASNSEAIVKAERSPKEPFSKLQKETIEILDERAKEDEAIQHERRPNSGKAHIRARQEKAENESAAERKKHGDEALLHEKFNSPGQSRRRSPSRQASADRGHSPTQIEVEYLSDTTTVGWVDDTDIVERESVHIISLQDKLEMDKKGPVIHEGGMTRKAPEGLNEKDTVKILTAQEKLEREGKKPPKSLLNPFSNL